MAARIASGDLDRFITIETPTPTVSDRGEPQLGWATVVANEPARYRPKHGVEALRGGGAEIAAEADAVFLIRYRTDVGPKERITFGGDVYDILSVVEYGRGVGVELVAKVRRAD